MSYNHYEEAERVISLLKDNTYFKYAQLLVNSIEEGGTGTEVFMALKYNLDIIINNNIPDHIKTECVKLRGKIENTLERL